MAPTLWTLWTLWSHVKKVFLEIQLCRSRHRRIHKTVLVGMLLIQWNRNNRPQAPAPLHSQSVRSGHVKALPPRARVAVFSRTLRTARRAGHMRHKACLYLYRWIFHDRWRTPVRPTSWPKQKKFPRASSYCFAKYCKAKCAHVCALFLGETKLDALSGGNWGTGRRLSALLHPSSIVTFAYLKCKQNDKSSLIIMIITISMLMSDALSSHCDAAATACCLDADTACCLDGKGTVPCNHILFKDHTRREPIMLWMVV